MKFKTFMPVLALACVCAVGQADAAQDRLMMPEQPAEPLNVIEAEVAIPVPSEEVRDVVNAFTQFQLDQKGKYIMDDSRVMKGQERYRNNVLYYMNVRRSWYIVSHRYKKDSYARMQERLNELSSVKADNARMQQHDLELTAKYDQVQRDNEEMKAQIALLMQQVGLSK